MEAGGDEINHLYSKYAVAFPLIIAGAFILGTKKLDRGIFLLLTFTNFLTILGYILLNVAISLTPVALVMVVIGVQSFMVLIEGIFLSIWFPNIIKEDIQKSTIGIKIFSIALIFIGIYLINT